MKGEKQVWREKGPSALCAARWGRGEIMDEKEKKDGEAG